MIPIQARSLTDMRDNPRTRRKEKYSNVRTIFEGMQFDSKAELKRWLELQILRRAGHIAQLERQVEYVLIPSQPRPSGGTERKCSYIADFRYLDCKANKVVIEDVKGAATPEYRIKRKLMLHVHRVEIREVKA